MKTIALQLADAQLQKARSKTVNMLRSAVIETPENGEVYRIAQLMAALDALDRINPALLESQVEAAPAADENQPAYKMIGDQKVPTGNTIAEEKRAAVDDAFAQKLNRRRNEREAGEAAGGRK